MTTRALILDFDGLMVDSEMPEYLVWKEAYEKEGAHLRLEDWLNAVGYVNGFDPVAHLEMLTGRTFDWKALEAVRIARLKELRDVFSQKTLPGVRTLIEDGARLGYRLGVASNSTAGWVLPQLERLGLLSSFATIRTRESVARPKPAPDLYLLALQDLDASIEGSFAFEDSHPGVTAAKAAGLHVVAVPNALTRFQDLTQANQILESLEYFRLPPPLA
jgi:HAD superfamily hydrolase (TIGR01509 family)